MDRLSDRAVTNTGLNVSLAAVIKLVDAGDAVAAGAGHVVVAQHRGREFG